MPKYSALVNHRGWGELEVEARSFYGGRCVRGREMLRPGPLVRASLRELPRSTHFCSYLAGNWELEPEMLVSHT